VRVANYGQAWVESRRTLEADLRKRIDVKKAPHGSIYGQNRKTDRGTSMSSSSSLQDDTREIFDVDSMRARNGQKSAAAAMV
jgi:hypothetical protein